jgi:hypothetical protein
VNPHIQVEQEQYIKGGALPKHFSGRSRAGLKWHKPSAIDLHIFFCAAGSCALVEGDDFPLGSANSPFAFEEKA